MAIKKDSLLAGRDPQAVFAKDGLFDELKKALAERVLNAEIDDHLDGEAAAGKRNSRNGYSKKTVLTETSKLDLRIPRDREGTFDPKLIARYQRRFPGFDEKIVSMYARGMTVREIQGHLLELYGLEVSPDLISTVTDAVLETVAEWQNRPLEPMYPLVFFDALRVKIRDEGLVRNKAVYVALGVTPEGTKDILGLWIETSEGAKFWLRVMTELKNRGVEDILIAVVDGLKGFPEAIAAVFPPTIVQTCIVHLIRNSMDFASWKDRKPIAAELKAIYRATDADVARRALEDFNAGELVVGADWRSGVYLAKLEESVGRRQSYVIFVVRDDNDNADVVFELPVNTYQAYNFWGGRQAYSWGSGDGIPWGSTSGQAAVKVSFNRPYAASTNPAASFGMGAGEFLCNVQPVSTGYPISSAGWDYNLVRWLEREGYYVTYVSNVDTQNARELFARRRVFITGAHDEYWSWQGRANLEQALAQGTNLFFSGANAVYWQVRAEPDRRGRADRHLAIYKEKARELDPVLLDKDPSNDHLATTQWRLPPVSRPEDKLIGVCYLMDPVDGDIIVSDASHWAFANTGLVNGSALAGLLGYEVDGLLRNAPNGLRVLAASPAKNLKEPGRTVVSNMTTYVAPSGAQVFATGSIQWCWGLDDFNAPHLRTSRLNPAAAQIARNVLERFGAKLHSP